MPRVNVYVADELLATVHERLPGVSPSQVLQDGFRALLGCEHAHAICGACAQPIDIGAIVSAAQETMGRAVLGRLFDHVWNPGATLQGSAVVIRDVVRLYAPRAAGVPLPRLSAKALDAQRNAQETAGPRHLAKVAERRLEPTKPWSGIDRRGRVT